MIRQSGISHWEGVMMKRPRLDNIIDDGACRPDEEGPSPLSPLKLDWKGDRSVEVDDMSQQQDYLPPKEFLDAEDDGFKFPIIVRTWSLKDELKHKENAYPSIVDPGAGVNDKPIQQNNIMERYGQNTDKTRHFFDNDGVITARCDRCNWMTTDQTKPRRRKAEDRHFITFHKDRETDCICPTELGLRKKEYFTWIVNSFTVICKLHGEVDLTNVPRIAAPPLQQSLSSEELIFATPSLPSTSCPPQAAEADGGADADGTVFMGGAVPGSKRAKYDKKHALVRSEKEIDEMVERLKVPGCVANSAKHLFKVVHSHSVWASMKGPRTTETAAAACVYIACRQEGVPRTLQEICAVSSESLKAKTIGRCFTLIKRAQGLGLDVALSMQQIPVGNFIDRFCVNLGLSHNSQVATAAKSIADKATDKQLIKGRPVSIAAVSIYMAAQVFGLTHSRTDIVELTGSRDNTIRAHFNRLVPHAKDLFPEEFKSIVGEWIRKKDRPWIT